MVLTRHFPITGRQFRGFIWIMINTVFFSLIFYAGFEVEPALLLFLMLSPFPIMFGWWGISDYNDNSEEIFTLRGIGYKWKSVRRNGEYRPRPQPIQVPWGSERMGSWVETGLFNRW